MANVPPAPPPDSDHFELALDAHSDPPSAKGWLWIVLAAAIAVPWLIANFFMNPEQLLHDNPALVAALAGVAILGAAFLLSWAAEAFQMDVSQALALALLSLIAVLPEYAVDAVFAWNAAADPAECRTVEALSNHELMRELDCQAPFAVANMTGANRLLIGVGWSAVVLLAWFRTRKRQQGQPVGGPNDEEWEVTGGTVHFHRGQSLELAALGLATIYSFLIPLKYLLGGGNPLFRGIGPLDTVILVALFALYAWGTARAPAEDPHLVGPAASIGALPAVRRRAVTYGMFAFAAAVIFVSAHPFAEGLVHSGEALGVDEFLLVQWLAPFASESPEFLVALLFAWRGAARAGLRTLVASKVNQWTLLIGTLGAVYSIASGALADLPLDNRQTEELFLTSAQSLFALAIIANFDMTVREAGILLVTFLVQLFFPQTEVRVGFAIFYVVVGVLMVVLDRGRRQKLMEIPAMVRETVGLAPPPVAAPSSRPSRAPAG